jgi:hypothetical protein
MVPGHPGWVRYSADGDLIKPSGRAGLGFSALTLKLVHVLGLFPRFSKEEQAAWIDHVRSFQVTSGSRRGYFEDASILSHHDGWFRRDWLTRRAETRQALTALLNVGARANHPAPTLVSVPKQVLSYVRELDWQRPWGAGSQASHLAVFLHFNAHFFNQTRERDELLPVLLNEFDRLQDPLTGCWGSPSAPSTELINGAMKVQTAYAFLDKEFPNAEQLIDFALDHSNKRDACHQADIVYALHQCTRISDYRKSEIRRFAEERIDTVLPFRRSDGGFSFNQDGTGLRYYGVDVATGRPVSDIHGTKLLVWTLAMLADILDWRDELGWELSIA